MMIDPMMLMYTLLSLSLGIMTCPQTLKPSHSTSPTVEQPSNASKFQKSYSFHWRLPARQKLMAPCHSVQVCHHWEQTDESDSIFSFCVCISNSLAITSSSDGAPRSTWGITNYVRLIIITTLLEIQQLPPPMTMTKLNHLLRWIC